MEEKSFRKSMSWLHTWSGLVLGWLLFAIFVTGTSSYYRNEITLWMQPETHKSVESKNTFDIAIEKALAATKRSDNVSVTLPNSRSNLISIRAQSSESNNQRGGNTREHNHNDEVKGGQNNSEQKSERKKGRRTPATYYDASTGEKITPRETAGGSFLYRFHFELYSLPRDVARWIVGIATMAMFVAIITGIIIHKRIFKDIFTFRAKSNPRGWMDAHILPAVASIPFLIMITYSGLLLFTNTLMPWGMKIYYSDFREYRQDMSSLRTESTQENKTMKNFVVLNSDKDEKNSSHREFSRDGENSQRGDRSRREFTRDGANSQRGDRSEREFSKNNIEIKTNFITKEELSNVLAKANESWPNNIGSFSIEKASDNSVKIEVKPKDPESIFNSKGDGQSMTFDAKSAKLLSSSNPPSGNSFILNVNTLFTSLHMALFADNIMRFIFFLGGLTGIVLSGTGLILWIEKRKKKYEDKKSFGFILVEKLNVGTIVGIFIAIGVYFITNRVVGANVEGRESIEIGAFFTAWLVSYIYVFVRNTKKGWIEQLIIAAIIYLSIPILNSLVWVREVGVFSRDAIFINFDLYFLISAFIFGLASFILIKRSKKEELKCQ